MWKTLYHNRIYSPFFGLVEINCATREHEPFRAIAWGEALLEEIKETAFDLGVKQFHLNHTARQFHYKTFGNHLLEPLSLRDFRVLDRQEFEDELKAVLIRSISRTHQPFDDGDQTYRLFQASTRLPTASGTEFLRFEPSEELERIMPDGIGNPMDYFECFLVLGRFPISGESFPGISVIKVLND